MLVPFSEDDSGSSSNYSVKLNFRLVLLVLVKMTVATIYWARLNKDHPEAFEALL